MNKPFKKSLTAACIAIFTLGALFAVEKPAAQKTAKNAGFSSGWKNVWPDGVPTDASFAPEEGALVISGDSLTKGYGCVYKNFMVDMENTPCLVIDVKSVKGLWYIIAKNQSLKEGYVRVQSDTPSKGKFIYDLSSITGLNGKRDFEIQVGISSGKEEPNKDKAVVLKDFGFRAKTDGFIDGSLANGSWQESWSDGSPTGAVVKMNGAELALAGISKSKSYGSVYRTVTVDLDKTPYLLVAPKNADGFWYLEVSGGQLKDPVKIQMDTQQTELASYDLKRLTNLSGVNTFDLHIGVSSGGQDPNEGKQVVLAKDVSFAATGESK